MRVVYLNPCGQLGGAETSLLEVLAGLRAAAPDWELHLVLGEDGPLAAEACARGAQVLVEPLPVALARLGDAGQHRLLILTKLLQAAGRIVRYRRRLARILREMRPDVIHTNGFKMHVLGAWARPRSASLVWHVHDYVSTRPFMSRLLRVLRKSCAVAVVNSKSVASDLRSVAPGLKVVPIYNAIDLERFSPHGPALDLDAKAGLPPAAAGSLRVGLVGTFARWKGHGIFLQALAKASLEAPVRGYVIGGPIYQTDDSQWSMEELQEMADRLGISGKVGFTGFLRDIPGAMRSLDIVIHASTQPEPFGMVIIEAMACGKPVIVSQAGGASELFTDGEHALAHRPGDAAALARQITRLARDESLRRRLGRRGRERAEEIFHGRRLSQELLAVYAEITGEMVPRDREFEFRSSASPVQE